MPTGTRSFCTSKDSFFTRLGCVASVPTSVISSVWPSPACLATKSAPILPDDARLVLDDDRLADRLRQLRPDQARQDVGGAARRVGHDDVHLLGEVLGLGRTVSAGQHRQSRKACQHRAPHQHDHPPRYSSLLAKRYHPGPASGRLAPCFDMSRRALVALVLLAACGPGPALAQRSLAISAGRAGHRPQRHGGDAGGAREPHRRRHPQARRQRGRRRGRGRLRDGGDLSARRQYRRRRLHGDPSRRRQAEARAQHRHRLSRDARRRPPRATCFSTRTASPTRRSRATRASPSACPAPWRASRWRTGNTVPGKFTLAQLIAPAIELARKGFRSTTSSRTPAVRRSSAGALSLHRKALPEAGRLAARARRPAGAGRSCRHAGGDRQTADRARSTKARSPTGCRRRCARPAD